MKKRTTDGKMPSMTAWRQKKKKRRRGARRAIKLWGRGIKKKEERKKKKGESTRREERFEKYAAGIKRGSDTDKSGVVGAAMRRP